MRRGGSPVAEWCATGWGRCIWAIACISASVTANACLLSPPQCSRLRLADLGPFLCSDVMHGEANQVADCSHVHTKFRCLFWPANCLGNQAIITSIRVPYMHRRPQALLVCGRGRRHGSRAEHNSAGCRSLRWRKQAVPVLLVCGCRGRPLLQHRCIACTQHVPILCRLCLSCAAGRARNPALTYAL